MEQSVGCGKWIGFEISSTAGHSVGGSSVPGERVDPYVVVSSGFSVGSMSQSTLSIKSHQSLSTLQYCPDGQLNSSLTPFKHFKNFAQSFGCGKCTGLSIMSISGQSCCGCSSVVVSIYWKIFFFLIKAFFI